MRKTLENILHLIIVVTTVWAIGVYFVGGHDSMGNTGAASFRFFTTDSNIVACLGSALCLITARKKEQSKFVELFRFVGMVCVSLTFLTVVFFLVPNAAKSRGFWKALSFFAGNVFVLHLTTPVLSVIAFLISERPMRIRARETLYALLPVFLYASVYWYMVVGAKKWRDWYGFTFGGKYYLAPIVLIVLLLVTAVIAFVEWKLKRMQGDKR